MIDPTFLNVLRQLYVRLNVTHINWAVTGSLGFALQGVPVSEIHDIDLQSDEAGAYEIERLFADHVIRTVAFSSTHNTRSRFGALLIDGVKVELMGDLEKRPDGDAEWDAPVDLNCVKRYVQVDDMHIPVLDLEYEHQAYVKMGRIEKAKLLRQWLDNRS